MESYMRGMEKGSVTQGFFFDIQRSSSFSENLIPYAVLLEDNAIFKDPYMYQFGTILLHTSFT